MSGKADKSRNLVFHMLSEVLEKGAYSNIVLQKSLKSVKLTQEEKSFLTALFYGTITRLHTLDYYLKKNLKKKYESLDPSVHQLLRMGLWQLLYAHSVPSFAAVNETVKLAKLYTNEGGVRLVNAVLRSISAEIEAGTIDPEKARFDVKYSLNRELSGCLIKWYGEDRASSIAEAYLKDPIVTARVNTFRIKREDLVRRLNGEGVDTSEGRLSDDALILSLNGHALYELDSFRDGLFMIQDEAAMLAAILMDPEEGWKVLDVCSAPGGKTCHIAEKMRDKGRILALDINESRLQMVEENQARLGLTCIDTALADATDLVLELPDYNGYYNAVLADVPCSGLGLLLRKPDIRHTMTYEKMNDLLKVQETILNQASFFVRPGGTLIYSTCTINPHENDGQADAFLMSHEEFEEYPFDDILPRKDALQTSGHLMDAKRGRLKLLPDEDGCDGFYIARFRRKE